MAETRHRIGIMSQNGRRCFFGRESDFPLATSPHVQCKQEETSRKPRTGAGHLKVGFTTTLTVATLTSVKHGGDFPESSPFGPKTSFHHHAFGHTHLSIIPETYKA